jgi:hypothetical protein
MIAKRVFVVSLVALAIATCAVVGFFAMGFLFFNYRGSGMDWMYPASRAFSKLWLVSAGTAAISGIITLTNRFQRRKNRTLG